MARLIQLENGDWIDPATVTGIRTFDAHVRVASEDRIPPTLVVDHGVGQSTVKYPDGRDGRTPLRVAQMARDALARIVNEAKAARP